MGDSFAVPSLAAALLLGLRERMGGNPDHIAVVTVPVPVADGAPGEVRDALLLHDTVPGGTGYLTDLVDPDEIWRVLATAHQHRGEVRVPTREPARLPPLPPAVLTRPRCGAVVARGG